MKTLFLLRHAKSSWKEAELSDFDRPLNERGRRAAPFMGRLLRERGFAPELIISSTAKRARKTARLLTEGAQYEVPVIFDDRIYEASSSTLLYVAGGVDNAISSLMLIGHNPGMEGAIRVLTGQIEPMPTTAVAIIDLDIENWKEIAADHGSLKAIFRPRDEMA